MFLLVFRPPCPQCLLPTDQSSGLPKHGVTGGKGSFTQWVHAEYMVGSKSICSHFTQQAHEEYFLKEPINSPPLCPLGKVWVLFERTCRFAPKLPSGSILGILWKNLSICSAFTQWVKHVFFHKVPINLLWTYPVGPYWVLCARTHQFVPNLVCRSILGTFWKYPSIYSSFTYWVYYKEPIRYIHFLNKLSINSYINP